MAALSADSNPGSNTAQPGGALMSRRRRRRRGGERERTRFPHHGTPLVEGSLIPQGQRPCVCGSGNRSNGSEFPDSSITNIFHSSLPSFASLPPSAPRSTLVSLSLPSHRLFRQRLLSFSFPFSLAWREPHERAYFFSLSETING